MPRAPLFVSSLFRTVAVLLVATGLLAGQALAQSRGAGKPGVFDYYLLTLSWSPSHCELNDDDRSLQCAGGRPYSFIVHGLWPQYDRGWPEFCRGSGHARVKRKTISRMISIMPSAGLIRHQWNKHGTCSGLQEDGYFEKVRQAHARVRIPPAFAVIDKYVKVDPDSVEAAFRAANPGLAGDAIHVTCGRRFLREVRICMTKGLDFMPCPELERRSCRLNEAVMPPVR